VAVAAGEEQFSFEATVNKRGCGIESCHATGVMDGDEVMDCPTSHGKTSLPTFFNFDPGGGGWCWKIPGSNR
jgi:hypothetical protein